MRQFPILQRFHLLRDLIVAAVATLVACGFTAACHSNSHPDNKQAVYDTLTSHDLASIMVDQDRDKGVITLKGIVGSPDRKDHAQTLAQRAAPGYTIDNQIKVEDIGLVGGAKPSQQPSTSGETAGSSAKESSKSPKKK